MAAPKSLAATVIMAAPGSPAEPRSTAAHGSTAPGSTPEPRSTAAARSAAAVVPPFRALVLALACLAACWHPLVTPSGVLAIAAVTLAGLALAFMAHAARIGVAVTARPLTSRAAALREKSRAAVFQRQLNPDAAGHERPRAPSAAPAAA